MEPMIGNNDQTTDPIRGQTPPFHQQTELSLSSLLSPAGVNQDGNTHLFLHIEDVATFKSTIPVI